MEPDPINVPESQSVFVCHGTDTTTGTEHTVNVIADDRKQATAELLRRHAYGLTIQDVTTWADRDTTLHVIDARPHQGNAPKVAFNNLADSPIITKPVATIATGVAVGMLVFTLVLYILSLMFAGFLSTITQG